MGMARGAGLVVAVLCATGFGASSAQALDGACGSARLGPEQRVALWDGAGCSGSSVAIGTSGNGDRANFTAFANINGATVNFNDRASTFGVRAGNCIRVFDGANYTGAASGLLCAKGVDGGYTTSTFDNKTTSIRVCRIDRQDNCAANGGGGGAPPPTTPAPGSPATPPAPGSSPEPAPDPAKPAAPGCVPKLSAGLLRASSACFTMNGTVATSKSVIRINGVEITPGAGGTVAVDTKKFRVVSSGPANVRVGPLTMKRGKVDWTLTKSIELGVADGNLLAELPVQGLVKLTATPGNATVEVTVLVDKLGGVSGNTSFTVGMGGFVLNGIKVGVGEINLGGLKIKDVELSYENLGGGGYKYLGTGGVELPGGQTIGGSVGFGSGGFFLAEGSVDGFNKPIAYGIVLQRIKIGFQLNPSGVRGSIGLSAGPQVEILGNKLEAASIDGGFEYLGEGSGSFEINGTTKLLGYDVSEAKVKYQFDGKLDFSGSIDLSIKGNGFEGGIEGWVDGADAFNAEGRVDIKVAGFGVAGGEAVLSSEGVAGCRRGGGPDFGFGYHYGDGGPDVVFSSCDIGPYREERVASTRQAAPSSQPVFRTFGIGKGSKVAAFAVLGVDQPPQVTVTDPKGAVVTATPDAPGEIVNTEKVVLFRDAETKTTYVVVDAPTPGVYKLALETGSGRATAFRAAESLPAPSVSARVRGKGRTRTLSYSVQARRGQIVRFYEQGRDTRRFIAASSKSKGTKRFEVPDGRPGRRQIVAIVEQDGVPNATGDIASYNAPPPRRPATPKKVRIREVGGNYVVTWKGAPRAAGYEVRVYVGDGRRLAFYPGRLQRSIVVDGARPGLRANVTVRGLTATNRRGSPGRDSVRPR